MHERKGAHLNYEDRCAIEDMLKEGESLRGMARRIGVSPTTVADEIARNKVRRWAPRTMYSRAGRCARFRECEASGLCGDACDSRASLCKRCRKEDCYSVCPDFEGKRCPRLEEPSHVCNGCARRFSCDGLMEACRARAAQLAYEERVRSAHAGAACFGQDLSRMVAKVRGMLAKGHSLEAIWIAHGDEFPVGVRTFYNYMNRGVMGMANIELPRKVRYKARRASGMREPKVDVGGARGRTGAPSPTRSVRSAYRSTR